MNTALRRLLYFAWTAPFIALFVAFNTIGQPHLLVSQRGSNCHYMSVNIHALGFTHFYDRTDRRCALVNFYKV